MKKTDGVSEWSDRSVRELLFQWTSTIQIQLSVHVLIQYKVDIIIIVSSKLLTNICKEYKPQFWYRRPWNLYKSKSHHLFPFLAPILSNTR
jgi:hypothetical protein